MLCTTVHMYQDYMDYIKPYIIVNIYTHLSKKY